MKQKYAKLRVCASCEWIFRKTNPDLGCPQCGFAHYGARYVYGNKCYIYEKTQKPWFDKKIRFYEYELLKTIRDSKPKEDNFKLIKFK